MSGITNFEQLRNKFKMQAGTATTPWLCLRTKVPFRHLHSFISLMQIERTVWLPARNVSHQPDWQLAGLGCAMEITAQGSNRFLEIQKKGTERLNMLSIFEDAPPSHFPSLRFLGGAAFAPQSGEENIWSGFKDARFIIPRWQYGSQSADATLQLVISKDEFVQQTHWESELQQILSWLEEKETLKMPATESVSITHFSNGWEALVNDALRNINAGTLQKVVVSRMSHLKSPLPFSLQKVLDRLARSYPDCTRFAVSGHNGVFVGATPEQLVNVSDGGKRIVADALAGSSQRTGDSDDGAIRLRESEKERREFEFVLDNIESQLRLCGVRITSDRDVKIKTLKNLYHLFCPVTGITETPNHVLQFVDKLHPTPAVCGTPTRAAANWLIRNEHQSRGWYAGPVGWFNAAGDGSFVVGIRSALIKENNAWLFAGAGIVEGSSAAVEFTETGAKLTPMLGALGAI